MISLTVHRYLDFASMLMTVRCHIHFPPEIVSLTVNNRVNEAMGKYIEEMLRSVILWLEARKLTGQPVLGSWGFF